MNQDAFALIVLLLLAAGTAGAIVCISALIGRRSASATRRINYECGLDPGDEVRRRFPAKFFLTAMLFVVFDVEIVLLFPWAVSFRRALGEGYGALFLAEILAFLALIALALVYAWGRGALRWEE